jgi:hypothetical protein
VKVAAGGAHDDNTDGFVRVRHRRGVLLTPQFVSGGSIPHSSA